MPTVQDFHDRLRIELENAGKRGESHLIVNAGDLHRLVGGYPGPNHRMPACCLAMEKETRPGDEVIDAPPLGQGPSLKIRYMVPR